MPLSSRWRIRIVFFVSLCQIQERLAFLKAFRALMFWSSQGQFQWRLFVFIFLVCSLTRRQHQTTTGSGFLNRVSGDLWLFFLCPCVPLMPNLCYFAGTFSPRALPWCWSSSSNASSSTTAQMEFQCPARGQHAPRRFPLWPVRTGYNLSSRPWQVASGGPWRSSTVGKFSELQWLKHSLFWSDLCLVFLLYLYYFFSPVISQFCQSLSMDL